MSLRDDFRAAAAQRILIKDGPYGTEIQAAKLSAADYAGDTGLTRDQKGNNDLVNLTRAILRQPLRLTVSDAQVVPMRTPVPRNSSGTSRSVCLK